MEKHTSGQMFVFPLHPDRFSIGAYRRGSLCIKVAEANPAKIITGAGDDSITEEEAEANARRLVACWNACDGIPTELLEEAKCWAEAGIASVTSLRQQQADLVESLRWALRRIETAGLGQGEYFAQADAVLAKAEGK